MTSGCERQDSREFGRVDKGEKDILRFGVPRRCTGRLPYIVCMGAGRGSFGLSTLVTSYSLTGKLKTGLTRDLHHLVEQVFWSFPRAQTS